MRMRERITYVGGRHDGMAEQVTANEWREASERANHPWRTAWCTLHLDCAPMLVLLILLFLLPLRAVVVAVVVAVAVAVTVALRRIG